MLTERQHNLIYLALCDYYDQAEEEGYDGLAAEISQTQEALNAQRRQESW